nr:hypothetical protein [Tanacetum cinerariifolium]
MSQISPVHAIPPILSTKEPEYSPSMGYEHPNTTLETKSDEIIRPGVEELVPILNEIIRPGVEELVPILSENEVTSEDKRECDVLVCENSLICDDHSEIFSDSKNDDDISIDNDDFKDIEYVEASLPDPEIVSVEEENDNSIPPDIENFADDSEGDIRFLESLLIDDSIPFPNNESSKFDFDNPSFPRPPPEPPDAEYDFELDEGVVISVMMNSIVEFECLYPRDDFDVSNDENDDYSSFMLVISSKMFLSFLSAESEDTIFDLDISV